MRVGDSSSSCRPSACCTVAPNLLTQLERLAPAPLFWFATAKAETASSNSKALLLDFHLSVGIVAALSSSAPSVLDLHIERPGLSLLSPLADVDAMLLMRRSATDEAAFIRYFASQSGCA